MRIHTETPAGGPALMRLDGDLDAASSPRLKAAFSDVLAAAAHGVVLDLSGVPFIDSSGLGALVAGLKAAKQRGVGLALAGIHERAQAIFQITMADRIFDIFPTTEAAFTYLAGAREA